MRLPRPTTRRMMALVALAALFLAGLHGPPRPGLYYPLGELRIGVCRNDLPGRSLGLDGKPMGWMYEAGAWPAGRYELVRTGLYLRDGQIYAQLGGRNLVLW